MVLAAAALCLGIIWLALALATPAFGRRLAPAIARAVAASFGGSACYCAYTVIFERPAGLRAEEIVAYITASSLIISLFAFPVILVSILAVFPAAERVSRIYHWPVLAAAGLAGGSVGGIAIYYAVGAAGMPAGMILGLSAGIASTYRKHIS